MNLDELSDYEKKKALINHRHGSVTKFAEYLGTTRQSVNKALRGAHGYKKLIHRIQIVLEERMTEYYQCPTCAHTITPEEHSDRPHDMCPVCSVTHIDNFNKRRIRLEA